MTETINCKTPEDTYELGERIGGGLRGGDAVLLYGGLGAGKTLLTKGILDALGFDADEVTSPSFSLVNRYKLTELDVYHIDLWRIEPLQDAAAAIGLDEILEQENAIVIIEWAERLSRQIPSNRIIKVSIAGDGEDQRVITIS